MERWIGRGEKMRTDVAGRRVLPCAALATRPEPVPREAGRSGPGWLRPAGCASNAPVERRYLIGPEPAAGKVVELDFFLAFADLENFGHVCEKRIRGECRRDRPHKSGGRG